MAVQPMYFQPLSFQQASPITSGMQVGSEMMANAYRNAYMQQLTQGQQIQNQFLPQNLQAKLAYQQLQNQNMGIQNKYLPGLDQADIGLKNAQSGYYGAESQQALANANLTKQRTPYLVQQDQTNVYTDPVMKRLFEIGLAQKTGAIPSNLLGMVGFGNSVPSMQGAQSPTPTNTSNGSPAPINNALQSVSPASAPNLYNGDPATNFALFGSPYNPIAMKAMETSATTGVTQYNDAQAKAADSGDLGNQLANLVNQFQSNYSKTDLTGPFEGRLPAVTSASQAADNASQNLAATVAKLIAGGRVTNYEMQYINSLKPNRTMTPQTAQMTSDFLKQKSIRMQEQQSFLNSARNQGTDVQTANALWGMYNNQRPVYNFSQNTPNTQFQKTWSDYLTPQAIVAAKTGQNYVPLPSFPSKQGFQNWYSTLNPADQTTVRTELAKQGGR